MQTFRFTFAIAAAAGLTVLADKPSLADDAVSGGLVDCAAISDDMQRLACFDALAARHEGEPAAPPAPPPTPAAAPASPAPSADVGPTPITDEIGRERVEGPSRDEAPVYTANVTRCEENRQSGQTYFFFENGQVWRQANYRRLRLRDCRFEVNLSEDNFGYSMYIPSEDRRFRVTRIR